MTQWFAGRVWFPGHGRWEILFSEELPEGVTPAKRLSEIRAGIQWTHPTLMYLNHLSVCTPVYVIALRKPPNQARLRASQRMADFYTSDLEGAIQSARLKLDVAWENLVRHEGYCTQLSQMITHDDSVGEQTLEI
jgi:hypothetical protein